MRKIITKLIALALCVALCLNLAFPSFAGEVLDETKPMEPVLTTVESIPQKGIVASGTCGATGSSITWVLDNAGKLTISGDGLMVDYSGGGVTSNMVPWWEYKSKIYTVVIGAGVTHVGAYAFSSHPVLESAVLSQNINSIGDYAFADCERLANIELPDCLTTIGIGAFSMCDSLVSVHIPRNVTNNLAGAFQASTNTLQSITVDAENTVYYAEGNCLIETATNTLLLGCQNSVIPDSVVSIDRYAFVGCASLKEITIPSGVASLYGFTFDGCSTLEKIYVDNDNTKYHSDGNCLIETATNKLIVGCKTSIIPGYVTCIGAGAFEGRDGLKTINIPDSVTSIENNAFNSCNDLEIMYIPDSVLTIGAGMFQNCESLREVTFSDSMTTIPNNIFWGCTSLTNVVLPSGLKNIDGQAFSECHALVTVDMPSTVVEIGGSAFFNCSALKSASLPGGLVNIGALAFSGCESLASDIIIPGTVESIGSYAFYGCMALTSVVINNGVKSIGTSAFWGCSALENISIPDSVESIGDRAFSGCSSVTSIFIPAGVTNIGTGAFGSMHKLQAITVADGNATYRSEKNCLIETATNTILLSCQNGIIPDDVTSIGSGAFDGCVGLTSITIPASVTSIHRYAIQNCPDIESLSVASGNPVYHSKDNCIVETATNMLVVGCKTSVIPDYVVMIDAAFNGCSYLEEINIPENVLSIGRCAFQNCVSLKKVSIPAGVSSIHRSVFSGCSGLESIEVAAGNAIYYSSGNCLIETATKKLVLGCKNSVIPTGVISIDSNAFNMCDSLVSITIPDGVQTVNGFRYCTSLVSISLPDSVTTLEMSTFMECTSLTSITIPKGVTEIEVETFSNCTSLTSITIPDTITFIGNNAFEGCTALNDVYYMGTEDEWERVYIHPKDNDPLLNATVHYNVGTAEELPEPEVEQIGSITATVMAPEGGWKVGENTFKVEAEKACYVAVSYDGGETYVRVPAIQDANGGYRFTAENMDANTVISVGHVGDVDGDGIIRARDARLALQAASGMTELNHLGQLSADLDGDGIIRAREARLMLQAASDMYILEW